MRRAVVGASFDLELSSIPAVGLAWVAIGLSAGSPFPIDLSVVGATGCSMYSNHDAVVAFANTGGVASWSLPLMPMASGLVGASVFVQGFAVDAGANPLGLIASNAREGVVGSS